MKKVVTLGSATQDIFIMNEGAETMHLHSQKEHHSFLLLETGIKVDVQKLLYATGGGATNSAVAFKRMGLETYPCFKIGTDHAGTFIVQELEKEGFSLDYALRSEHSETAISFITPTAEHNYTALCYRGTGITFTFSEIPLFLLEKSDYCYIASLSGSSFDVLEKIVKTCRQKGIVTASNPSKHQIMNTRFLTIAEQLDILILNSYEARILMHTILNEQPQLKPLAIKKEQLPRLLESFVIHNNQTFTLYDYFNLLFARGNKMVVVTDGSHGVYIGTPDRIYFHAGIPVNVVTALGAGDAFGSTFVGALALDKSLDEAIRFGVVNAASVISFFDAKTGLLSREVLEKNAAELNKKYLSIIPMKK